MKNKVVLILACLIVGVALLLSAGCAQDDSDDSSTSESATENVEEAEPAAEGDSSEEDASSDGASSEISAFVGTWENAEGGVFRVLTLREDGTADTVNYAGSEAPATWTLEDIYMKVETDGGESYGSDTMWISDTEWDWAYEDGTWTLAE